MSYYHKHDRHDESYEEERESFEYSREDLERMYEDAFEGDPEAYWNID